MSQVMMIHRKLKAIASSFFFPLDTNTNIPMMSYFKTLTMTHLFCFIGGGGELLIEFEFVSYSSVPFFFSPTSITLIIRHSCAYVLDHIGSRYIV
jgi:hypothetical protein